MEITKTDQAFIDNAASRGLVDWYKFSKKVYDKNCWNCKKAFKTRLELNRYCSPACRDKYTQVPA